MKHSKTNIFTSILFIVLTAVCGLGQGNVGIGTTTPDSSAILELQSTSKGILIPRMDSTQRVSIPNPKEGLMVYETTSQAIWTWDGMTWKRGTVSELNDLEDAKSGYLQNNLYGGQGSGQAMGTGGGNNTAWGKESLFSSTGGDDNTAIGHQSLYSNLSGSWNTAVGAKALKSNTGNYNTAVGRESMKDNTSGYDNTAVGSQSLWRNEEGKFNTAIGDQAMLENESGDNNVGIGNNALSMNVMGISNTAVGSQALENNINHFNTAIGYKSLSSNTTGDRNVAIGSFAMHSNQVKSGNVAIGDSALYSNGVDTTSTYGINNLAVGSSSLKNNAFGSNNIAIGREALYGNVSGSQNTVVGVNALKENNSGSLNSAYGSFTLEKNISSYNAAFGENALRNSKEYQNSSFGVFSSSSLDMGIENTVMGAFAFNSVKKGDYNVVVGSGAFKNDTVGYNNTVIGAQAMSNTSNASKNTVVGAGAGAQIQGDGNVFLGNEAGFHETGSDKLYVDNTDTLKPLIWGDFQNDSITINGFLTSEKQFEAKSTMHVQGHANFFNTSFFRDVVYLTGKTSYSYLVLDSSSISVKPVAQGDTPLDLWLQVAPFTVNNNYGDVRIPSHSRLGLGTSNSPTHSLTVQSDDSELFRLIGNGNNGSECRLNFGDGDYVFIDEPTDDELRIQANRIGMNRIPVLNALELDGNASKTTAGNWLANSDRRIKENVKEIENSFELVKRLRPVTFNYTEAWKEKNPSIKDRPYYNFIAQEYGAVFPHAIQGSGEYLEGDSNEILQIDTYDAQIVTIQAVKDLIEENDKLKRQVENLNTAMMELRSELISLIKESAELHKAE